MNPSERMFKRRFAKRGRDLNAERDTTIVLEAFDTLSNKRDYTAAEWF